MTRHSVAIASSIAAFVFFFWLQAKFLPVLGIPGLVETSPYIDSYGDLQEDAITFAAYFAIALGGFLSRYVFHWVDAGFPVGSMTKVQVRVTNSWIVSMVSLLGLNTMLVQLTLPHLLVSILLFAAAIALLAFFNRQIQEMIRREEDR